jgi:hypothetical protein
MKRARAMSAAEFEALRARGLQAVKPYPTLSRPAAQIADGIKAADSLRVSKARTTVNRKAEGRRVMCLDLSTTKTGMAWGQVGQKPEGTMCLVTPAALKKAGEGERLNATAKEIVFHVKRLNCGFVIFSEFYAARMMLAFRANAALRGAVMAYLAAEGIEALPVAEITARKAAGVDITRRKDTDPAKGYMKARAATRLAELGLGHLQEDEGDAAILLLGATAVVEIGAAA